MKESFRKNIKIIPVVATASKPLFKQRKVPCSSRWHHLGNQHWLTARGEEVALHWGLGWDYFWGDCVLAQHFHRWTVAGLFVSLSRARCCRAATPRAGSWGSALQLPLQTLYYCPFLQPGHEKQAVPAKLEQGSLFNWSISMCRSDLKGL